MKIKATTIPSPLANSTNKIGTKLSSQKISFPSSAISNTVSKEESQMLFGSAASSQQQNQIVHGVTSSAKKISFDLKNQTSLTLNSTSNNANANNSIKSIVNASGMPFMNYNNQAINNKNNKIMIGNSAGLADSNMHKQLNYQILKTISNKNNTGVTNLLSPSSKTNNVTNGASLYANMQGFKGNNYLLVLNKQIFL